MTKTTYCIFFFCIFPLLPLSKASKWVPPTLRNSFKTGSRSCLKIIELPVFGTNTPGGRRGQAAERGDLEGECPEARPPQRDTDLGKNQVSGDRKYLPSGFPPHRRPLGTETARSPSWKESEAAKVMLLWPLTHAEGYPILATG